MPMRLYARARGAGKTTTIVKNNRWELVICVNETAKIHIQRIAKNMGRKIEVMTIDEYLHKKSGIENKVIVIDDLNFVLAKIFWYCDIVAYGSIAVNRKTGLDAIKEGR